MLRQGASVIQIEWDGIFLRIVLGDTNSVSVVKRRPGWIDYIACSRI